MVGSGAVTQVIRSVPSGAPLGLHLLGRPTCWGTTAQLRYSPLFPHAAHRAYFLGDFGLMWRVDL